MKELMMTKEMFEIGVINMVPFRLSDQILFKSGEQLAYIDGADELIALAELDAKVDPLLSDWTSHLSLFFAEMKELSDELENNDLADSSEQLEHYLVKMVLAAPEVYSIVSKIIDLKREFDFIDHVTHGEILNDLDTQTQVVGYPNFSVNFELKNVKPNGFEFDILADVGGPVFKIGDVGSSGYEDKLLKALKFMFISLEVVVRFHSAASSDGKVFFDDNAFTSLENAFHQASWDVPSTV